MTSTPTHAAPAVLAGARRARHEADLAEARVLAFAVEWAALHEVPEPDGATWGETSVLLAGEGAPAVGEFCLPEFAAALGVSTDAGRALVAAAMELAHRLPLTWAKVQDGTVRAWRARRVAERTPGLSAAAAAFVDAQVAGFAHRISGAALDRLVEPAIERYMPDRAESLVDQLPDPRRVEIHHDAAFTGLAQVEATIDLADGIDLEEALRAGAAELAELGSTDSLDVRRSLALGALARGDQTLALTGDPVTLYVHVQPGDDVAVLENGGTHLLRTEHVATWCARASSVTVTPVIDLAARSATDAYAIPHRLREQVVLRDRHCVFPWCERPARSCDLDHIVPFAEGGPTAADNLASC